MAFQLGDAQQVTATVSFSDAAGNAALVEAGSVVWASSDASILTVTADTANENTATVAAAGSLGTASVTVSADADLGDGVITINGSADVEVVGGQAAAVAINFGTPEPIPAP